MKTAGNSKKVNIQSDTETIKNDAESERYQLIDA